MELTREDELDARVKKALGDLLLTGPQLCLLRTIALHRGVMNAITAFEILRVVGLDSDLSSRRWLKATVADLIERLRVPIGALRMPPYGYFLIVTLADRDLAIQPLLGEIHSLLRRMRALTSPEEMARLVGQTMLKLESGADLAGKPEGEQ